MAPVVLAALTFVALLACRPAQTAGGTFEAHWTGADTGAVATTAEALWCEWSGVLEVRAVQGDTGVALAVRADSAPAGTFDVALPDSAGPAEGAAAVAVRWFGETVIEGFRGLSGTVTLTRGAEAYSGAVEATLVAITGADTLRLDATFQDAPLQPAAPGCAGLVTPPADPGVS